MAYGMCLKHKGITLKFILDTTVQARDVIWPIVRDMLEVIPADCLPVVKKADMEIHFPNGSIIKLGSSNKEHCDKLRGSKCDIVWVDEAGFHDAGNWEHVIYSLLMPQMLHSNFGHFIFTTTPPVDIQHPFILHELNECRVKSTLVTSDIHDNVFLTPALVEEVISGYRQGKDDPNYKREHLLELLPAHDLRVTPEFEPDRHVYSGDPYQAFRTDAGDFTNLVSYVSFDYGVLDNTSILLGLLDWRTSTLYVTEEKILHGREENYLSNFAEHLTDTNKMAKEWSQEQVLIGDAFEAIRNSLLRDHGIVAGMPSKHNLEGSIGVLRNSFLDGKIKIHDMCIQLITDLTYALWKESESDTKKIARSSACAHADSLMALTYMNKRVNYTRRPGAGKPITLGRKK
jgi:hypothetical protein